MSERLEAPAEVAKPARLLELPPLIDVLPEPIRRDLPAFIEGDGG